MSEERPKGVPIQIDLDPEIAQGMYVNMAMVNSGDAEFTIDFIYVQPQAPKAKVRARVISSPRHTKRLLSALAEAVEKFERKHGEIATDDSPPGHILN